MKKYIVILLILSAAICLNAQIPDLSIWNNIRNSAYTADDSMHIRYETIDFPGLDTSLYYFDGTEWQNKEMNLFNGLTYEAVIPALYGGAQPCRFKTETDTLVAMMPALIQNDVFPPDAAEMSLVAPDSVGDCLDPDADNLDLIANYFGYSDSRFYSGISNVNNSFPLNSGGMFPDTYYFYVTTIINPENVLIDSVGYAMIYCNIPVLLPAGLYRINGTEISFDTLEQIGNIEAQIVDDQLILACDLTTLTNDEYFGDWPSVSKSLIVEMVTAKFAFPDLFLFTDMSKFSLQFIDQYVIEPFTNVLPEISDADYMINTANSTVWFNYFDENGHFPLVAELSVNGEIYDFLPLGFDYSEPVIFETTFPSTNWNEATIIISDNNFEFVEETVINNTGIANGQLPTTNCELTNYPNPFNPSTTISFSVTQTSPFATIEIFNLKGQKVKTFTFPSGSSATREGKSHPEPVEGYGTSPSYSVVWNGTDDNNKPVSSGIYFYKLKSQDFEKTNKCLLLK
ncbi:MAG: hypothetical protein K9N09_09090 [Candidatus Cloacimonetes bacterium]|nr:hypothetical protein [Candidatus Cloacimonadota bacterium]MCF7814556.1 hypothetical protein [Candidatus Cloacimonadota bacterium]MCF7868842.1 hypothetical protein [Candidatus Cloacimonadota bacterium]MCF7884218.1 hypothetical protein [Candidatus Cloacimonadota bacterium]